MQPRNNDTKLNASILHDKQDKGYEVCKMSWCLSYNACKLSRWLLTLAAAAALCVHPHYLLSFLQPCLARCSSSIFISQGASARVCVCFCVLKGRLSERRRTWDSEMVQLFVTVKEIHYRLIGRPPLFLPAYVSVRSLVALLSSRTEIRRSTRPGLQDAV